MIIECREKTKYTYQKELEGLLMFYFSIIILAAETDVLFSLRIRVKRAIFCKVFNFCAAFTQTALPWQNSQTTRHKCKAAREHRGSFLGIDKKILKMLLQIGDDS